MKIPAQAFSQVAVSDLAPGSLFIFRDRWAVRVSSDADFQGFVLLEGERMGRVFQLASGTAHSIAIMSPFAWFPALSLDAKPMVETNRTPALTLTCDLPVIVGIDARETWEPNYLAFGMDGQGVDMPDLYRAARFEKWSVELCHRDRPYVSLGTLVEVGQPKEA